MSNNPPPVRRLTAFPLQPYCCHFRLPEWQSINNTTKLMLTAAHITVLRHWLTELQLLHKNFIWFMLVCMYLYIYIHIYHDDTQYKALGMLVSIYSIRIATVRLWICSSVWTPKHKLQHLPTQRFKISERRMNFLSFRPLVLPLTETWTCRWVLGVGGIVLTGENRITRTVTCPSDTSPSTNPTRTVRYW